MKTPISGYHKKLLDINLSTGETNTIPIPVEDIQNFIGGRGLGMKILWNRIIFLIFCPLRSIP